MLFDPALVTPELVLPASAELGGPLVRRVLARGPAPRAAVVLATLRVRATAASALAPPRALIAPDSLGVNVAVTRAHTPTTATTVQQDAAGAWVEVGQNLPRWSSPLRRLRVDPSRTNGVRNPRGEGLVAGTSGTLPTNWSSSTTASGITRSVVGYETINGVSCVVLRFAGTASATAALPVLLEPAAIIAATVGQVFAVSALVRATHLGATPGVRLLVREVPTGTDFAQTIDATTTAQRFGVLHTVAGASNTSIRPGLSVGFANGQVIDSTIAVGLFQCELGGYATLPILPVAASPAATTRAADAPIWTPSAMPARGAILLRGSFAALAGASPLGLLQADDGTDSNRIVARVAAGGGQPECLVIASGVTLATLTPVGVLAPGAQWRALLAWSPGAIRFGTSSGGVVTAPVPRPPGLSRALLGHANAAGTLPLAGEIIGDLYDDYPSEAEALSLLA
jgi:hypothetical protein